MSDISKINPNGTEYNLKDATARAGIESSKTLKSSVVTVTDAAPINAEDITVDITPVQDLHGYDRPWAGGAGKNLLPMTVDGIKAANTSGTWNGNDYTYNSVVFTIQTDNDGNITGIKVNGTPSSDTFFYFGNINFNGSYKVSGYQDSIYSRITVFVNNRIVSNIDNDDAPYSLAVTLSDTVNISIKLLANWTFANNIVAPMVCLSTETDPTFAPYSNICPIEGRTGAELDRVEGYFDGRYPNIDTSVKYRAIQVGNGTFTMSSDANGNNSFALLFFLAGNVSSGASSANNGVYNGHPVTVTTNDGYVTVGYRTGAVETQTPVGTHTKIEKGAVATPYQGKQYTASFGETVHGGKWHVTAGGTDKTMAEVDLGSLTWIYQSVYQRFYAPLVSAKAVPNDQVANALCTQYELIEVDGTVTSNDGVIGISANRNVIVRDTRYTDAAAFKTAVTGVQLAYELATPTTISTPKQNVPMLKGINTVSADCGDVSLKYQPDNVVGELKGEIEDSIIYEDYKWTTESSRTYSAGTPGTYGCSSWRDVKKEGYDVIGVTFVENRRFGDCILTLYYIPSTSRVEVIIFRATSSSVTIADEDITYRVAYKKH